MLTHSFALPAHHSILQAFPKAANKVATFGFWRLLFPVPDEEPHAMSALTTPIATLTPTPCE